MVGGRGLRQQAVVLAAAVVLGAPAGAGAAKVPAWQRVAPAKLGVRFSLAADWGIDNKASLDKGWTWEAFSPGQVAWMRITSFNTSDALATIVRGYTERVEPLVTKARKTDPQAFFGTAATRIGGVSAVRITIRMAGFSVGGQSEHTTIQYFVVHAGVVYEIEFDSPNGYLSRFLPRFEHTISTMSFPLVA